MSETFAVVLAAGLGTRMKSNQHKVLHSICGKPMIRHVIDSLRATGVDRLLLVVGAYSDQLKEELGDEVEYVHQSEQLGTGHAVIQTRPLLENLDGSTLICYGDTPLVTAQTYQALLEQHRATGAAVTMLTAVVDNPFGLGRILRAESGEVLRIVEEKDATEEQKQIREINPGLYCFSNKVLFQALSQLNNQNSQGEYYLTDCIEIIKRMGLPIKSVLVSDSDEILGVNDRVQLAQITEILRKKINEKHMRNGVTLLDPKNTYIDVQVEIGPDTVIAPSVTLTGNTVIGSECSIGPGSQIDSSRIGNRVSILSSVIRESVVGQGVTVGPFAYIRPGSQIGDRVKVGDFVEIKNSTIGEGSKVPHLAYVGDADIGSNVNVGCGVITVNYDGVNKHRTIVGDNSFIGSNVNLIAPIQVGSDAYIATGSTVTDPVPDGAFAIARERQVTKENYSQKLQTRLQNSKPQK